ncbi:FUSC family protein [Streptomyces bauhiniae]|uniref:FUSC family protein n=1 Tax=Streptomyces bauhiniae TaxID=2340725 RepID=UPI0035E03711
MLADRRWHTLLPLPEELLEPHTGPARHRPAPAARAPDPGRARRRPAGQAARTAPPPGRRLPADRRTDLRRHRRRGRHRPAPRRRPQLLGRDLRRRRAALRHRVEHHAAAVQRTLGTAIGLLLTSAVLFLHPGPVAIICLIIVFEFFLEYVVARNYGLGVVFLTPLALLLSELSSPVSASRPLHDRVIGSGIGISVGLVCALLLVHGRAAVRMREALHLCTVVSDQAEHALHSTAARRRVAQVQLAASAVELYEAKEAASGELRPTGVDPAAVAAEHRAYDLLGRLSRAVLADDRVRRGRGRRRPGAARPS